MPTQHAERQSFVVSEISYVGCKRGFDRGTNRHEIGDDLFA